MAFSSWQEPVRLLQQSIGAADAELAALAVKLGIDVRAGDSRLLVIARVEDEVASVTNVWSPRPSTDGQCELLQGFGIAGGQLTFREADALIRENIWKERIAALRTIQPSTGDILVSRGCPHRVSGDEVRVSSIDRFGSVWAKHARGRSIWPQHLVRSDPRC